MKQLNRRLPRIGHDPPPHHHHHHHHHDKCSHRQQSSTRFGLVARGGVAVALVIAYVNFHSFLYPASGGAGSSNSKSKNGNSSSNKSNNNTGKRKPLRPFPEMPYPPIPPDSSHPLDHKKWDRWAQEPLVGSYTFVSTAGEPQQQRTRRETADLHLPIIDLEDLVAPAGGGDTGGEMGLRGRTANDKAPPPQVDLALASPDYVVLTRKGEKYSMDGTHRQPNQDRVGLLSSGRPRDGDGDDGDWWIGLFDGHGSFGHSVAQYSMLEFLKRMEEEMSGSASSSAAATSTDGIQDKLRGMFLDVHRSMPHLDGSGCTGISIWKRGRQLFISNVGDSLAFVVRYYPKQPFAPSTPKLEIIYRTQPHKPDTPAERKRIEGVGGQVEDPPYPGLSARLLIPSPDGLTVMALAMSRSLGDHDGEPHGLLAEPTTDVLDLQALDRGGEVEYLVVACTDGLVDRVDPLEVGRELALAFLSRQAEPPSSAAERLIMKSSAMWAADAMEGGYRDDISIVVRRLVLP
jgi:serine/threonine protein phosphatase PrpC